MWLLSYSVFSLIMNFIKHHWESIIISLLILMVTLIFLNAIKLQNIQIEKINRNVAILLDNFQDADLCQNDIK